MVGEVSHGEGEAYSLLYFRSSSNSFALNPNGEHQRWRRKPFRFEAMWLTDSGCRDIVTRAWECSAEGMPMFVAAKKLKKCKKMLKA